MRILLFSLITLFSSAIMAQYAETVRSDRPGKSIVPFTVGKNVLQFQHGFGYSDYKQDINFSEFEPPDIYRLNMSYTSHIIRFGLSKKFEINTLIDYSFRNKWLENTEGLRFSKDEAREFRNFAIGARYNILEGKNGGLAWGIQTQIDFKPVLFRKYVPEGPSFQVLTSLGYSLFDFAAILVNLGYTSSDRLADKASYSVHLRAMFNKRSGISVGNYGHFFVSRYSNTYPFDTFFDAGFFYFLKDDVELDLQAGYSQNSISKNLENREFIIEAGVSWRLNFNN